ncbi:MAG: flagellar hook assembly protein FlgD [Rhizobiales bacterium]|nr:flagellar hook assembly protein FlgD [Hyphomicrobiales bacterium]
MIVNPTVSGNPILPKQSDATKTGLDYDAFLKLMLQQLKSQDPLNPVDQATNLAQLASFSNVEQSIKLNDKLDDLLQRTSVAEATALIGKNVQSLVSGVSGIVAAVEVSATGSQAVLANGTKIPVSEGLRIKAS